MKYELEHDGENGYMDASRDELAEAIVGHKIVNIHRGTMNYENRLILELDNGRKVIMRDTDDCCAYTQLNHFLVNVEKIDHVITGVGTEGDFSTWHIFADFGDVLQLDVSWSAGSGYYGYGFYITVEDPNE